MRKKIRALKNIWKVNNKTLLLKSIHKCKFFIFKPHSSLTFLLLQTKIHEQKITNGNGRWR